MKDSTHSILARRHCQRGAIAIAFGLTLAVLLGFAGLAVDLSRFFVIKSELQNAMDACALAASSQLRPGQNNPNALTKAVAYGSIFLTGADAIRNKANFQSDGVLKAADLRIEFSDSLAGSYQSMAGGADFRTAAYVRCVYPLAGLPVFFIKLLNPFFDTQTVTAMAVATLAPSASSCTSPVGLCKQGNDVNFGLTSGDWLSAPEDTTGVYGAGNFGWIDFDLDGSGASAVNKLLVGSGKCGVQVGQDVAEAGKKLNLATAWNSRFGIYPNAGTDETLAPPDVTGYSYTPANWTLGRNAFAGSVGALYNYPVAAQRNEAYQFPVAASQRITNQYDPGNARRLVVAPVVDCNVWNSAGTPKLEGFACVLLLAPFDAATNPQYTLEYLGPGNVAGSACATHGEPGSAGPLVPQLIQ
ncbi:MAG: pilus assembly protein TadG-related protein [Burkholderiales bacterium]